MRRRYSFFCLAPVAILLLGALYTVLVPPFEAPDEPTHFLRAYGVSEGQFCLRDHPRTLIAFLVQTIEARLNGRHVPFVDDMKALLATHQGRIPVVAFNTIQYCPVPYLLDAVAIKLVTAFDDSAAGLRVALYLCRLLTLSGFAALVLWAMVLYPEGRWIFFWVATAPMALAQAAVVSPDSLVVGAAMVLVAASLSARRDVNALTGLCVAIALLILTKPPYAPLLLVPAACTGWVWKDRWKRFGACFLGATVFCLLGAWIWYMALRASGGYAVMMHGIHRYRSAKIDPTGQAFWIVSHPLAFGMVAVRTLVKDGLDLFHQLVGVLGWLDVPIPWWAVWCWAAGAAALGFVSRPPSGLKSSRRVAVVCLVAGAGAALLVMVAIYMIWMPVGAPEISLQGRYFLPVAVFLLTGMGLAGYPAVSHRWQARIKAGLLAAALIINGAAWAAVCRAYY